MALFDFLKRKELAEIACLTKEIEELRKECESLSKFKGIANLAEKRDEILTDIGAEEEKAKALKSESRQLLDEIENKKTQIAELDETILLQEFGMYSPIYDFANSEMYKDRLNNIRTRQKKMILDKKAATCATIWTINGSKAQGRTMTNQNIKQILRCFNDECDMLISKVKFNNILAYTDKINKSADALNRMNSKNAISLSPDYVRLKIEELQLAYEYAQKKQEEKEEQKRIREQMREEAKLMKEIEEARKDIEKEQKHYTNALHKLNKQLEACDEIERDILLQKKKEIESHLTELDSAIKEVDYREANKKAGYVYIISNIGSFGENVYKIGMTRRLDPMERVEELGDASVPFKFDVHALIFSDDAPKLEAALHRAFANQKVNMVNNRREFFKVTLEEIEDVVRSNYDKTVEFIRIPEADQYRESVKILEALKD
ncbi:MAG: DUF4041 domain-containing protein [Bacteroidales bacterium]|nr:DUF4041 domain-containing protein [Bacteroidales bacterium]MCM1148084.1 DUF4041 domain-containing protein [Bacteroidales bacterium]MCM1509460.1 DUF4041 domain-containing protein [Clostridium sp.]